MLTLALATLLASEPSIGSTWTSLGPGVEYGRRPLDPKGKTSAVLHVVRVDPERARLKLGIASRDGRARTAAAWADQLGLVAVTNAGMFDVGNHLTHVGRLVDGAHLNQAAYNDYRSALLLHPRKAGLPEAQVIDLDDEGAMAVAAQYGAVVQNLRLVKGPGVSVWKPNGRAWSEAAVAQDKRGRILFLFVREGHQMSDFNRLLLASELEVVRAMHMEGGPEASLSVRGAAKADLFGSYETGFVENDGNLEQWVLPNVLGVVMEPTPAPDSGAR